MTGGTNMNTDDRKAISYWDIKRAAGIDVLARQVEIDAVSAKELLHTLPPRELYELERAGAPVDHWLRHLIILHDLPMERLIDLCVFYQYFRGTHVSRWYTVLREIVERVQRDYCPHVTAPKAVTYPLTIENVFRDMIGRTDHPPCLIGLLRFLLEYQLGDVEFRLDLLLSSLVQMSGISLPKMLLHRLYDLYAIMRSHGEEISEDVITQLQAVVVNSCLSFSEAQRCSAAQRSDRIGWHWLREALLERMFFTAETIFEMKIVWTTLDTWYKFYCPLKAAHMKEVLVQRLGDMESATLRENAAPLEEAMIRSHTDFELRVMERVVKEVTEEKLMEWLDRDDVAVPMRRLLEADLHRRLGSRGMRITC